MDKQTFNLTTDPWIKVIERQTNQTRTVSLIELFEHAQDYRQLAGEMHAQDLVVLRFLLAILTTVYSRFDADDEQYDWLITSSDSAQSLVVDEMADETDIQKDLLATWRQLNQAGHFSAAVTTYLKQQTKRFDFFGERPFYQVTTKDYDALVPKNKQIAAGKGQVALKQLNRRISESNNTPALFSPKAGETKNELALDELVRWVMTYQNFTGVTDKTKVVTDEKFSNSAGWPYRLNPVFAKGTSLFETLMLNLILVNKRDEMAPYTLQKPVWEYPTVSAYIDERKQQLQPDNLAALYTTWSRILHIEWDEAGQPTIFSAGIPIFAADNALIEPMTTWRLDKKTNDYRPAVKGLRSLGIAMWRNFGQYVKVRQADDSHEPGIVIWLRTLKEKEIISHSKPLILNSVALISDGNATSQAPAVEVVDDMQLQADVLFDPESADYWPLRIEDTIELTQTIGTDYYHFATDVGRIRNLDVRTFANGMSAKFYEALNEPFKAWLADLTGDDNREEKINLWKQTLESIVVQAVDETLQISSPRDIKGINTEHGILNIFTAKNRLMYNLRQHLKPQKG
ncbi:type I-E CRISPR-associated protein Cse1/CasA [Lactobacillus sp. CBA3606]|uniref:type I-E CRISPR-associated protein Cse1/CasA n=1 Tax=Lactobacillus sp. CBA3606 TaxID=2099789 RepID=UPI000CFC66C0|nr:type I-E CRISPR-associated protein Cse1/CasA [Lactobacillus sp. CBA3606]AVK64113.1 type I-E CRISPR-associated protein Cse1/CasA [Lactobacillus sp. CBA3606]